MFIQIDDLQICSVKKNDTIIVKVQDKRNIKNKAKYVFRDGTFLPITSTFAKNSARKWELLYLLEVNKAILCSNS